MNKHISNLKIYFFSHKSFVISLVFILLLLVTFIKVNNIQIRLSDTDSVTSENIAPVDYSIDRSRFLCYAKKTPVDVQKTCDGAFPKNKEKVK
ncbi:hypothetical protein [Leptospira alstonii]|uniref:Uncharacterized protein n=1 Tax=Leptospira alstonii serovar Sichuan str. 79601 TaxID=1218565 RepID=M6CU36_9LEPT|nr:hypothetical protein [Leptospira alstonii]AGS80491.1 hypothetical protein LEP1GSC193_0762 [Leptospira phage vB_LalZ_80412-LE1]EMJ95432.1 hypothetical protein LEP1GSC194_3562 [Leptospira alstonii serovar Sichuan str. 79601]